MNGLEAFFERHPIWDTVIIFWIISAAINAMPEPDQQANALYRWLYTFLTTLVGHLHDAMNRQQSRPT